MRFLIVIFCLCSQAFATDTYNFYFPQKPGQKPPPESGNSPESQIHQEEEAYTEKAEVTPMATAPKLFTFQNRVQVGLMGTSYTSTYDFWNEYSSSTEFSIGPAASLAAEFTKYIGANFYVGLPFIGGFGAPFMMLGAEAEVMPLGSAYPDVSPVDFAMLGGVSLTMGGLRSSSNLNPYVGARLGFNLNKKFGIDLAARTNLSYYGFGAGAYVRF